MKLSATKLKGTKFQDKVTKNIFDKYYQIYNQFYNITNNLYNYIDVGQD